MMFWIWIGIIVLIPICTLIWIFLAPESRYDRSDIWGYYHTKTDDFLGGLFFSFVVVCIGAVVIFPGLGAEVKNCTPYHEKTIYHKPVNLADSLGTSGSIRGGLFYITGEIHSQLYWSWYEHSGDGSGLKSVSVRDDSYKNIRVKQIPVTPHINEVWYKNVCQTKSWVTPFNIASDEDAPDVWTLYVPKGTVKHEFSLDAK